jgi:hypothetical protein
MSIFKTASDGQMQRKENSRHGKHGKSNSNNVLDQTQSSDSDWQHSHQVYWQKKFKSLMAISI